VNELNNKQLASCNNLQNKMNKALTIILLTIGVITGLLLSSVMYPKDPCEYQMICTDEGYSISDGNRPVGFIPLGNTALDSLMIDDNQ
jgi:hypothetical protein